MITITKEFTKEQLISAANARMEFAEMMMAKDLLPLQIRNWSIELELARIALASLEAGPVAYMVRHNHEHEGTGTLIHAEFRGRYQERGDYNYTNLYTAQPASVVQPLQVPEKCPAEIRELVSSHSDDLFNDEDAQEIWNACRAAMLPKAGQATIKQQSSNSIVGWLRADYQDDNRGLCGDAPLFVLGKKDPSSVWGTDYIPLTGKSPVIPGGWVACSERMPEEDGLCLIWDGRYVGLAGFFFKSFQVNHYQRINITHWMPLPAAPQQK